MVSLIPISTDQLLISLLFTAGETDIWVISIQLYLFRMVIIMITLSNGNIFCVTGPLCGESTGSGEFPAQRPVTRSFDAYFDLRLNKRLSKQPPGWWLETPLWSLWRQCNGQRQMAFQRFKGPMKEVQMGFPTSLGMGAEFHTLNVPSQNLLNGY